MCILNYFPLWRIFDHLHYTCNVAFYVILQYVTQTPKNTLYCYFTENLILITDQLLRDLGCIYYFGDLYANSVGVIGIFH